MKRTNQIASLFLVGSMLLSVGCARPVNTALPWEETNGTTSYGLNLPTGTVQGRIVDSTSGLGIADVRVEVVGVNPSRSATTDSSGNFTISEVPAVKVKLALDKAGYSVLASQGDILVDVLSGATATSPDIKILRDIDAVPNSFVLSVGGLDHPRGVAVDSKNNAIYAVTRYGYGLFWGVKKYNLTGGFQAMFKSDVVSTPFVDDDHLDNPHGISVDQGGNVLIANSGENRVVQYSASGNYMKAPSTSANFPGLTSPYDIAVLRTGQMVVANSGKNSVSLFNVDRSSASTLLSNSTGLKGVAVDANDNVYVIDDGAAAGGVVKKIDIASGKVVLQFGYRGGRGAGYFEKPTDLAIDNRNGDIYVVDSGNNRVQRFNHDGSFLSEFGGMGNANGQFNNPSGIAVDSNGYVYVADTNNNRIQKFAPSRIEIK